MSATKILGGDGASASLAISLTTFRRNSNGLKASHRSAHDQDRGERIFDDIIGGRYECPICSETISNNDKMWSCRECYYVYHFACIKVWAKGVRFQCPTCKAEWKRCEVKAPRCWCSSQLHQDLNSIGNTCGSTCNKLAECESEGLKCHIRCSKICHPGPCEPLICREDCPTKGAANATVANLNALEGLENDPNGTRNIRLAQEEIQEPINSPLSSDDLTLGGAIRLFVGLAIFQIPLVLWGAYSIDKRAYPLEHIYYSKYRRVIDAVCAVMFGCFLLGSINAFIVFNSCAYFSQLFNKLVKNSNLQVLMCLLLGIFGIALILGFPIMFFGVPMVIWKNNMKKIGTGFDTKIKLSDYSYITSKLFVFDTNQVKVSRFYPRYRQDTDDQDDIEKLTVVFERNRYSKPFAFARMIDEGISPSTPFSSFYRMEGAILDYSKAVDFDLTQYAWRIVDFSERRLLTMVPSSTESLIKNGTWTKTTGEDPHTRFPELNLIAPKFHYFTAKCQYEGFMTFFKTEGMTEEEIMEQANRRWSPEINENEVMRTANQFIQATDIANLEVRIRRADYEVNNEWREGLGDDFIVPVGLMAILRQENVGEYDFPLSCSMF